MRTIAITGAAGKFGRAVLDQLGPLIPAGVHVRACTRDPARFDPGQARVDAVQRADFADPDALDTAFHNVDTLLLVSIEGEDDLRIRLHGQAIAAAARTGVRRIIYTSFFDVAPESPSVVARVHRLTEEAILHSGCAYTFLRNGPYVDNIAVSIAAAARTTGVFPMASGAARMPFIARADLALAAASALTATPAGNEIYQLSGSELLTYQALCDEIGAAVGAPVRHVATTEEEYRAELDAQGLSPALRDRRIAYVQAMRLGFMTALTPDFQRLVGRAPRTMHEVVPVLDLSPGQAAH
ncbi:quinone oxidoreductase 2 [Comamonadaceae bacterium OS-1]|nr:quinone oxidoreductase 2 [Comamonadaceae bacterium OS-1]